jgi:hypothetical protein
MYVYIFIEKKVDEKHRGSFVYYVEFLLKKLKEVLNSEGFQHAVSFLPLSIQTAVDYEEDGGMLAYDVR